MACATLKRSYDFDPVLSPQQQPCHKRRRYMAMKSSSPTTTVEPSKFLDVTPKMTSGKKDRLICHRFDFYFEDV